MKNGKLSGVPILIILIICLPDHTSRLNTYGVILSVTLTLFVVQVEGLKRRGKTENPCVAGSIPTDTTKSLQINF